MKILYKSLLHAILLFITVFLISATFILYFSPAEAGSISKISYWSFWVALPFLIFMFFSIYFILNSRENNKGFWKRFIVLIIVVSVISIILYVIYTIGETEAEQLAFAFIYFIELPAIFLVISFILTLLYKFLFRYSEKIAIFIKTFIIIISILAIIINIVMHGGCLPRDYNCLAGNIIEKGDISLCDNAIYCVRQFIADKDDETICNSLFDDKNKGIYTKSVCYSHFAKKKNDPSLCKFTDEDWSRSGCCAVNFNVDLYGEGLSDEQKSVCGIKE